MKNVLLVILILAAIMLFFPFIFFEGVTAMPSAFPDDSVDFLNNYDELIRGYMARAHYYDDDSN
uniref:SP13 phlebotomine family member n=1 Tax=Nyssomyia intermedia TaxID=182990 RepID=J7HHW8_9DIPT